MQIFSVYINHTEEQRQFLRSTLPLFSGGLWRVYISLLKDGMINKTVWLYLIRVMNTAHLPQPLQHPLTVCILFLFFIFGFSSSCVDNVLSVVLCFQLWIWSKNHKMFFNVFPLYVRYIFNIYVGLDVVCLIHDSRGGSKMCPECDMQSTSWFSWQ